MARCLLSICGLTQFLILNTGKENPEFPASMLVALLYLFMQACLHFCDTFLF